MCRTITKLPGGLYALDIKENALPEGRAFGNVVKSEGEIALTSYFCGTRILRSARVFRSARIRGGTRALGLARTAGGDLDGCVAGNACGGGRKRCGAGGKSNNAEGRDGFLDHIISLPMRSRKPRTSEEFRRPPD
jgi:hypothetical protein